MLVITKKLYSGILWQFFVLVKGVVEVCECVN